MVGQDFFEEHLWRVLELEEALLTVLAKKTRQALSLKRSTNQIQLIKTRIFVEKEKTKQF